MQFRTRNFSEELTILELKQQHRVPVQVVDFLEERLSDQLSYPSQRNRPLTAREQVVTWIDPLCILKFSSEINSHHILQRITKLTQNLRVFCPVIEWSTFQ